MKIYHGHRDHEALLERLRDCAAGAVAGLESVACEVYGSGHQMLLILRDGTTGEALWQCVGQIEVIVREFQRWIAKWKPN